ncbi:lipid A deacylase LpxR family protein [bacterium]|nr:lipid A deacylase LpxR family protein [bacterium]
MKLTTIFQIVFIFSVIIAFSSNGLNADSFASLQFDNDTFWPAKNKDRWYTQGMLYESRGTSKPEDVGIPWLLDGFFKNFGFNRRNNWLLGQKIYTPGSVDGSKDRTDVIRDDRPYAGWLYGGGFGEKAHENHYHRLDMIVGVMGPPAMSDISQNGWHAAFPEGEEPYLSRGWKNQIRTEIGLVMGYTYNYRIPVYSRILDSILEANGRFGNVFQDIECGVEFRLGWLPTSFDVFRSENGFRISYKYLKKIVIHNATMQGGLFNTDDSPHTFASSEMKTGVDTEKFGLQARICDLTVEFSAVHISKEFVTQPEDHYYGIIKVSKVFK